MDAMTTTEQRRADLRAIDADTMTVAEAMAELAAAGCTAKLWRQSSSLVRIYVGKDILQERHGMVRCCEVWIAINNSINGK